MNGDLQLTFIQKSLAEYNQRVIDMMKIAAKRANVGVTDEGINSLAYKILQQGSGAVSNLSFKEYLRMVDMGVGRGHPLSGLKGMSSTIAKNKSTGNKKAGIRKPKKIYSKIAYGNLTWLYNQLLYGFTEETIAMLKNELNSQ